MPMEYEFEGKTIEKAIENASKELNIPRESLNHEVISYGSTGIFGLVGYKKAKIRVFLDENEPGFERKGDIERDLRSDVKALVDSTFNDEEQNDLSSCILKGEEVLRKIVQAISPESKLQIKSSGKQQVYYLIEGGESAVLIGKRGTTLEAMQYLTEKIVNGNSERRIRVRVDVAGYLERRRKNLTETASKLAERAKKTGKPMTLGQMNPYDRRIVHITLKKDQGVRTQSIGSGLLRKLVIFPRNASRKAKNKQGKGNSAK